MNRATHLKDILADGAWHCSSDLTPELGTGSFRAVQELRDRSKGHLSAGQEVIDEMCPDRHVNKYGKAQYPKRYRLVVRTEHTLAFEELQAIMAAQPPKETAYQAKLI